MEKNNNSKARIGRKISEEKKVKKKKHRKRLFFKRMMLIVICIFFIVWGVCFIKTGFKFGESVNMVISKLIPKPKKINVLVLGVSTDISTELADTIMICSYNPSSQSAYMLSIPRDTFVGENINKAKGSDKINAIYTKSGAEGMKESVEKLTGIKIDYYAVVKNQAVIDVVDEIGGVEFNVPINMDYDDITQDLHIHLKSGVQNIDGDEAEQLLRFRHNNDGTSYPANYGDNDFGRMRTQREFIKETVKQTAKFSNVFKAGSIINVAFENVETNMGILKCVSYIPSVLNFNIENLYSEQLPGESLKSNSVWIYKMNKNKSDALINELEEKIK